MEQAALCQAFRDVLGVDNDVRKRAEAMLAGLEGQPGLYPALVTLTNSELEMPLRQSAVLFLKNSCKAWKDVRRAKLGKPPIPEADRTYLKSVILSCLRLSTPEPLRLQYEEVAKVLAENLFPATWPEVFPLLDEALQNSDPDVLYAGLALLFQLCKNYEFNMRDSRAELDLLVDRYFAHLLRIASLLQLAEPAFPFLQLILKTYWVVTYIDLRPALAQPACFASWLDLFKRVLELDLGALEGPPESEEVAKRREELPAWGCKRWSAQILHRCFQRNANAAYLEAGMKALTDFFVSTYSLPVTRTVLALVLRADRFLPNIVLNYLFKFLTQAIKVQQTAAEVKSQVVPLVSQVIMPRVCRVPSDEEVWRENPVEFIRKENDLGRAYYSAKSAALDLLVALCGDKNLLVGFMTFLSEALPGASLLGKEALLLAVGSLADQLRAQPELAVSVEAMLTRYVLADLSSEVGFLRARACWTYGQFASFPLPDLEHQTQAFRCICQLLIDRELPVKFEAALALPKLLSLTRARELLQPEVQRVLELYLRLMDEIDSEDLVDALEALVEHFSEAVQPYAVSLAQKLSDAFLRLAGSTAKDDEGDSAMAAVSVLNIEAKLLELVQSSQPVLLQLSHVLLPLLELTLSYRGCEFFEEGLNLLTCLLYYAEPESLSHLWPLYSQLLVAVAGGNAEPYALDHLDEVFSALANFISKYQSLFLQQGVSNIVKLVPYLLQLEDSSLSQHRLAVKLLICLLENFKGALESELPFVMETARNLSFSEEKTVRLLGVQLLAMSCWYNPGSALRHLGDHAEAALGQWLKHVPCFVSENGKRHMAFGLLALLLSLGLLQDVASPQLSFLLKLILQLLKDLKEMQGEEEPSHTSDPLKPEALYAQMLENLRSRALNVKREEEPEWNPADEDLYDSPLDGVDELAILRNALDCKAYAVIQAKRPNVHSQLLEGLSQGERAALTELLSS